MKTGTLSALAAILVAGGCAGSSGPSTPTPEDLFAFRMPSPPTASYTMADTMVMNMSGGPTGDMTMTMHMLAGLDLEFAPDPEGIRVTGEFSFEDARMISDVLGTVPLPMDALGDQTIEMLVNSLGEVEVISMPEIAGVGGIDFGASSDPTAGLFPNWPDHNIEPGDTWVDTTIASPQMDMAEVGASMDGTNTTILTYTFVGDTVVDGRDLLHIAYEGEVLSDMGLGIAGANISASTAGTIVGLLLWDAERGLVAYVLMTMDMDGAMDMPGLGSVSMSGVTKHHMRLAN